MRKIQTPVSTPERSDDKRVIESNSYIQIVFWSLWKSQSYGFELIPEYPVMNGTYRIDFAHPQTKTAVELDSWKFHGKYSQFHADKKRSRALVLTFR
jgi:very-short-patch-repair endonuclease